MANICDTSYTIVGEKEELDKLYQILEETKKEHSDYYWIGYLLEKLGINPEDVECRGDVAYIDKMQNDTDYEIYIDVSSAWYKVEALEEAIGSMFPDLSVYYRVEECGCGIFETNDSSGLYYSAKYYMEYDCDGEYYDNDEELVEAYNVIYSTDFKTAEEVENDIAEREDEQMIFMKSEIV